MYYNNFRKDIAYRIYVGSKWRKLSKVIMAKYNYLCVKCGKPADLVHHIIPLTPDNYTDDNIVYNEDNLIPLCINCHNAIHSNNIPTQENLMFNDDGDIIKINSNN